MEETIQRPRTALEQIALLASDGKLIKRPLLISEDQVLVGFKADEWNSQVK